MFNEEDYYKAVLNNYKERNVSILEIDMPALDCGVHLFNTLLRNNIMTLRDLCAFSEEEIQNVKGVSKESVKFLKGKLVTAGLDFRPSHLTKEEWLKELDTKYGKQKPKRTVCKSSKKKLETKEKTPAEQFKELLDKTIEELDFSVRPFNYLKRSNINVVKDLLVLSEQNIRQMHGAGDKVLNEVKERVESLGLELRPDNIDKVTWIKALRDEFIKKYEMKQDDLEVSL